MRLPTQMTDENKNPSEEDLKPLPKPKDDLPHDDPCDPMMPHVQKGLRVNAGDLDAGVPNHTDPSKRGFDPK